MKKKDLKGKGVVGIRVIRVTNRVRVNRARVRFPLSPTSTRHTCAVRAKHRELFRGERGGGRETFHFLFLALFFFALTTFFMITLRPPPISF